jgi:LuxR family maltose regulon positive regulatory protein
MHQTLLTTKLYFPPARSSLVSRPRLVDRLQAGLCGPLTLVSAPAGSGKTTLLSEWRAGAGSGLPVAWISLDAADNDPLRFFQYLSAALDTLQPGITQEIQPLLQSPEQPNIEALLTLLVNTLGGYPQDFVLVFDDYHVIEAPTIHEALTFLLGHQPLHMHLVFLTRADPPLPIARLRARGQLTEIRAADLRFSVDEAAKFLNQVMGLNLTGEQVAALEARSEGWITGLQLAALSMQGHEDVQGFISAFTGSHHYIVDYLAEEVLNCQPETVREFMLRTSIPDRLTAPLCNVLTNRTDGQEVLENLEHTNLFLFPLDDERGWYRYHHLFADVLRNQLARRYPEAVSELHHHAAEWFKYNQLDEEALYHYMVNNDFEPAAQLISNQWLSFKIRSSSLVSELLYKFPENLVRAYPRLSLIYAWDKWLGGFRNDAEAYVRNAQDALTKGGQLEADSSLFLSLQAETFAFQSYIDSRKEDFETAVKLANQALQTAPIDNNYTLGFAYLSLYNAYRGLGRVEDAIQACTQAITYARLGKSVVSTVDATHNLGQLLKNQGHLHHAGQIYQEGLKIAQQQGLEKIPTFSLLHFDLAEILYQWDNLNEAEHQLELGFKLIEQDNIVLIAMVGNILLAQLKRARGDKQTALKVLNDFEFEALKGQKSTQVDMYIASRSRLQAELGTIDEAAEWYKIQDIGKDEAIGYGVMNKTIQLARVQIALSNLNEALDLLSRIVHSAESTKSTYWLIEAYLLQAIVWHKKGESDQAKRLIEKALQMAIPEGYIRLFLDEGEPSRLLLSDYEKQLEKRLRSNRSKNLEHIKKYTSKLLAVFSKARIAAPQSTIHHRQYGLIDPLSERELEVLRQVAMGKSNQQIADTLFITSGTVKKHLNNIFGKLSVQSRMQCVVRARELNLL